MINLQTLKDVLKPHFKYHYSEQCHISARHSEQSQLLRPLLFVVAITTFYCIQTCYHNKVLKVFLTAVLLAFAVEHVQTDTKFISHILPVDQSHKAT